jgi:predicted thioesterase
MQRDPETGAAASVELIVRDEDTAAALSPVSGDAYPAVLATTRCIALCELAAGKILVPLLAPGELSVGVVVDVTHIAATPVGALAKATARYRQREGKLFVFDVTVEDPAGEVMRGTHKRAVIDEKRLIEGARKRGP